MEIDKFNLHIRFFYLRAMQAIFDQANTVLAAIQTAQPKTAEELETFRIQYLGSKNVLQYLSMVLPDQFLVKKAHKTCDSERSCG